MGEESAGSDEECCSLQRDIASVQRHHKLSCARRPPKSRAFVREGEYSWGLPAVVQAQRTTKNSIQSRADCESTARWTASCGPESRSSMVCSPPLQSDSSVPVVQVFRAGRGWVAGGLGSWLGGWMTYRKRVVRAQGRSHPLAAGRGLTLRGSRLLFICFTNNARRHHSFYLF